MIPETGLKRNCFFYAREWSYKNAHTYIIIVYFMEEY